MELVFLLLLIAIMIGALISGFPVAFALPGAAIISIGLAALSGWLFVGNPDAFFSEGGAIQWLNAGVTNFRSIYWDVERDTLIAIPLFIFMGIMLQRSKIAEDLLVAMARLFGPIPGGLGVSVVLVGALLAATTGIVGATVIAMGLISLPAMLKNNYSKSLATGTICASGTLGQIIPPSIVLIILADQLSSAAEQASSLRKAEYRELTGEFSMPSVFDITSASAGDMFMGALIPGAILVGLYILYILATAIIKPEKAPPVPYEGKYDRQFAIQTLLALFPPLTLIVVVLGSIILGIATVNQAGAIGAIGATLMASYRLTAGNRYRYYPAAIALVATLVITVVLSFFDINIKSINTDQERIGVWLAAIAVALLLISVIWAFVTTYKTDNTLHGVMLETAKTTSMVFIILIGAAMLTSAFRAFGGEELVKHFLTGLPGGFWMQFLVVMAVIFLLGFFLDFIEIAVVVVPIVAPILLADPEANVTAVWLGVMIGMNIQTSFLTPPFGFALFYLRGVASSVIRTVDIYRGAVMFICLQLLALAIAGFFPSLVNYLPNRAQLTSETAPPPMNPRLQQCLEGYVFEQYELDKEALLSGQQKLLSLDLSSIPKKERRELASTLEEIPEVFVLVDAIKTAQNAVDEYGEEYRPLHTKVRQLQKQVIKLSKEVKELEQELRYANGAQDKDDVRIASLESSIANHYSEMASLEQQIPQEWESGHARFVELSKALTIARNQYRNSVDGIYERFKELNLVLASAEPLAALESNILALNEVVTTQDSDSAMDRISDVESQLSDVADSRAVKSLLSKARRALKRDPDVEEAVGYLEKAHEELTEQVAWRRQAEMALARPFAEYSGSLKNTIGLRLQERLTHEQALYVAACRSGHEDVSLNF